MAEAWLVFKLTGSGAAVGATFAFRFGPVLFFGLWGGVIADHFDRRRVMLVTQSLAAVLAAVLWVVVFTGVVQVWMLFGIAFLLGLVTVVDEPARQAFVEEMVGREKLPNAVALNSAVLNSAHHRSRARRAPHRDRRPAWVFFGNAVSYFAVVIALAMMRKAELHRFHRPDQRGLECARGSRTRGHSSRSARRSCSWPSSAPSSTTSRPFSRSWRPSRSTVAPGWRASSWRSSGWEP